MGSSISCFLLELPSSSRSSLNYLLESARRFEASCGVLSFLPWCPKASCCFLSFLSWHPTYSSNSNPLAILGHEVYKLHSHILLTAFVLWPLVRELPRCTLLISASCGLDHRHHSAVSSDLENSFRFLLHLDIRCCHICFTGALRSSQSPCVYHRSLINSARASSLNHKWSFHGGGIIDVALILHCFNAQN